jgi:tensin
VLTRNVCCIYVRVSDPSSTEVTQLDSRVDVQCVLQVYEGLIPVYTSGVYSVCGGTRQFTVNVAGERHRRGLQLRGDILLKCYHRHYSPVPIGSPSTHSPAASSATERPQRELIFACQFHTCAVTDYTLSFTRQELDFACSG